MPQVSIIIPIFNHVDELLVCLASLEKQTFKDFEVIIVDDASQEPIAPAVEARTWSFPVQLHCREKNGGAPAARNEGFRFSTGAYVLFLDGDIELNPDALQKMVESLEQHKEHSFAYSNFYFGWKLFKTGPYDFDRLKKMNFIHTSALIRREAFPGFDESLKKFQDWDLWLRMGESGKTGIWIPETLLRVKTGGTMSRWMPKILHHVPWEKIGWMPEEIRRYRTAEAIIRQKHHL